MLRKIRVADIHSGVVILGVEFQHVQVTCACLVEIALGAIRLRRFHRLVDVRAFRELQIRTVFRKSQQNLQQFARVTQFLCLNGERTRFHARRFPLFGVSLGLGVLKNAIGPMLLQHKIIGTCHRELTQQGHRIHELALPIEFQSLLTKGERGLIIRRLALRRGQASARREEREQQGISRQCGIMAFPTTHAGTSPEALWLSICNHSG